MPTSGRSGTSLIALARALREGLHGTSLDGFYHVARALLVHSEAHLDAFDEATQTWDMGVLTLQPVETDPSIDQEDLDGDE